MQVNNRLYLVLIIFILHCPFSFCQTNARLLTREFIRANWNKATHICKSDSGTLIGLPQPYSVPGTGERFQEMYYWDTYFTNVGLLLDGYVEQAKNNVANMLYLVERYGYMPNGNRTFYLSRSQSPYLSMMVRDVYGYTKDTAWLASALPALVKEYNFWMSRRLTPVGLNRYGNSGSDTDKIEMFDTAVLRLKIPVQPFTRQYKIEAGNHFLAECESGWDFSPRFNGQCINYCPVDLNCNLYMYEKNFSFFLGQLNLSGKAKWDSAAKKRLALIQRFCFNPKDGLFYDYNYVDNTRSAVLSAAIFNTLWAGVATKKEAATIKANLSRLEVPHGIVACEKRKEKYVYQWDYPNGWANLQYIAIKGLGQYGYVGAAKRIADKYAAIVALNFSKTHNLWEKYNMLDGSLNVTNEYSLPPLMGWTAGVFSYCLYYLNQFN